MDISGDHHPAHSTKLAGSRDGAQPRWVPWPSMGWAAPERMVRSLTGIPGREKNSLGLPLPLRNPGHPVFCASVSLPVAEELGKYPGSGTPPTTPRPWEVGCPETSPLTAPHSSWGNHSHQALLQLTPPWSQRPPQDKGLGAWRGWLRSTWHRGLTSKRAQGTRTVEPAPSLQDPRQHPAILPVTIQACACCSLLPAVPCPFCSLSLAPPYFLPLAPPCLQCPQHTAGPRKPCSIRE